METLNHHFQAFRAEIRGFDNTAFNPELRGIYADWTAAGQLYGPIEQRLLDLGTMIGNTHTTDSNAGAFASEAYAQAHQMVARAVNAGPDDIVLFRGNGMTGAVNWLQNALGLKGPGSFPDSQRPIVLVTGLEHHSNHISWRENGAEVHRVEMNSQGLPDLNHLRSLCREAHRTIDRPLIGSFSAASNVTGVRTPLHEMAEIVHGFGGVVVADYAASAPYDVINMHPEITNPLKDLDAVVFSPHKFLGGPGAPGVVVFNRNLYNSNSKPVVVGGGIVSWVDRDGACSIVEDIHTRESAGSPSVLGAARVALALKLKDEMDPQLIHHREDQILRIALEGLSTIPGLHILEGQNRDRIGIISFVVEAQDYALIVRLLSDKFGIQARGGCSCAGPYGHHLLGISDAESARIRQQVTEGDASDKPGWVRISFHPTMTDGEIIQIVDAVRDIVSRYQEYRSGYTFDKQHHAWHPRVPQLDMSHIARKFFAEPLGLAAFT